MADVRRHVRAELMPSTAQTLWGMPAVANFALGGLGAGFYAVSALAGGLAPTPAARLASWLGPVLVVIGLAAVAAEAGRPFRGVRVLARVRTSWMSRELWLAGVFVALALAERLAPGQALRLLAACAGAAFVAAQGALLAEARAVPAWSVRVMPLVFLTSAAVSGTGLLALDEIARHDRPSPALFARILVVVVFSLIVWLGYVTWSSEAAFTTATAPLRDGSLATAIVGIGYVGPFVLAALALALPGWATASATLAGILMIVGQLRAKAAVILTAGRLRPIALELTLRREGS